LGKTAAKGAQVQGCFEQALGTKDKNYSDVLYVEELVAPDTVNTIPPATMDAFRDHGKVRASLEENIEQARETMAVLDRSGISIDTVIATLVDEACSSLLTRSTSCSARSRRNVLHCWARSSTIKSSRFLPNLRDWLLTRSKRGGGR